MLHPRAMPRARRLALALALAVAAPGGAPAAWPTRPRRVIKGPYITAFTDTTADIRFELDVAAPASIEIVRERAGNTPPRKVADPTSSTMRST